ncbi:MAG TPA: hypothetical protein VGK04_08455 [Thermoanaerobaculia bacterium]
MDAVSITEPKNETAREIFEHVLAAMAGDPEMQRDRTALTKTCCSPRVPELLKRAPKPEFVDVTRPR